MNNIIPAIIAENFEELEKKVKQVEGFAEWVQIDVMDGKFVQPMTWYEPKDLLKLSTSLKLEAHLMVLEPELRINEWLQSGVSRVLVHAESSKKENLLEMMKSLKAAGIQAGVVFKMDTDLDSFSELISEADVVQLMSINRIGYYGQHFNEVILFRIKRLNEITGGQKTIEIDGGVGAGNIKMLVEAKANNFVVGSAIFNSGDIKKTILELQNI